MSSQILEIVIDRNNQGLKSHPDRRSAVRGIGGTNAGVIDRSHTKNPTRTRAICNCTIRLDGSEKKGKMAIQRADVRSSPHKAVGGRTSRNMKHARKRERQQRRTQKGTLTRGMACGMLLLRRSSHHLVEL